MEQFIHYESRAQLIEEYLNGRLQISPTYPEIPEVLNRAKELCRGQKFLYFPTLEQCWLSPTSHRQLFDLQGLKLKDLPGYEKAEKTARDWLTKEASVLNRLDRWKSPSMDETPQLLGAWLKRLDESSAALDDEPGYSIITDACLRRDEAVFLEIARVISNRQRRVELDLLDVQTAACWTKCLLWLMTNTDARTFIRMHVRFEKPGEPAVKYDAFTKMRQSMGLYQHPKSPLRISRNGSILGLEKLLASLSNVKR